MIYIVDNLFNYLIYLFIIHFGFRLKPRKHKLFIGASVLTMLSAGAYNAYFDKNSPIIYFGVYFPYAYFLETDCVICLY